MDIVISTCDGSSKFEFETYKTKRFKTNKLGEREYIVGCVQYIVTAKMRLERSTASSYSYGNKSAADSMVRL